jgi:pantetheine-phosphate adenylyltransferase
MGVTNSYVAGRRGFDTVGADERAESDFVAMSQAIRKVLCPGSFDPVTNGHLDIISRCAQLYDEVVVAVFVNQTKTSLFTVEERRDMLGEVTADFPNVRIATFHGLVVDYCKANDIPVIVKGMRAVSDFEYELQMAQMNRGLAGIDTLFMPTNPEYSFLASSLVKEIARWGGDVSSLVPPNVLKRLAEKDHRP